MTDKNVVLTNIKKILNKLTNNNFNKLKDEFICTYNTLYDEKLEYLNEIDIAIFDYFISSNEIYIDLYSSIFFNLININYNFVMLLNNKLDEYINIYNSISIPITTSFEEISKSNKINDKNKYLLLFYNNCFEKNILPSEFLFKCLDNLMYEFQMNILVENKKKYCESIIEYIYTIISKCINFLLNEDNINLYKTIYDNINKIKTYNKSEFKSLTNKSVFKCMDIIDKYNYNN